MATLVNGHLTPPIHHGGPCRSRVLTILL